MRQGCAEAAFELNQLAKSGVRHIKKEHTKVASYGWGHNYFVWRSFLQLTINLDRKDTVQFLLKHALDGNFKVSWGSPYVCPLRGWLPMA